MTAAPSLPELADLGLVAESAATLHTSHALRLARSLDQDDDILAGGVLPLTWIWVYFTPAASTSDLREDGHPRTSGSGALDGLDRRMWIGGSLERSGPLELDVATHRTSVITGADHKDGSTGPFVIVGVEHTYRQRDTPVLVEHQQILYRAAPTTSVEAPGAAVDPPGGGHVEIHPDERLLFRYSALTFNTHRIHYDHAYATDVEGYPGLVVHGPLTATFLADHAAAALGTPLTSFSFRAQAPTFAGTTLRVTAEPGDGDDLRVTAVREDGVVAMTATCNR